MSTVTASVVDVSRTIYSTKNGNRGRNYTGQCTPMPQPALGTQKIIQGNGTNVGTVITLQCPSRHHLVGGNEVSCVWGSNSTQWSGGSPWCKPVSPSEDFGFRVAVVASIISCAIILLMSIAFITCCLLDCVTEEEKKKEERETRLWHQLEQVELEENRASRYGHNGRNNNNNTQEKALPPWVNHDPSMCDNKRPSWYHQYPYALTGPVQASPTGPALNSAPLPCRGYNQPILPHISGLYHNPAPWSGSDSYHEQLKRNSKFLCLDQRMHTELVGRLVLQLNRTNPQILTDKEAQRFRNLSVPTAVRLAELLVYLQGKGEEEFHEFYRGLQIHTDKFYFNLPTRVSRRREPADPKETNCGPKETNCGPPHGEICT